MTSDLAKWLNDLEAGLGDLKVRGPRGVAIRPQQEKCQVRQSRVTVQRGVENSRNIVHLELPHNLFPLVLQNSIAGLSHLHPLSYQLEPGP